MRLIILARVILGAAEAPAFPAASKATGYWFPLSERGLATSSFDAAIILAIGIICYVALLGKIEQIQLPTEAQVSSR